MITDSHIRVWLHKAAGLMHENKSLLTELDAAIGDADHGINMDRGFAKVLEKMPDFPGNDLGALLKNTGMTLLSSVGGASGPLYGTFFIKAGTALAGKTALDKKDLVTLIGAGTEGILARGRAELQDKTMYDVWQPVNDALAQGLEKDLSIPEMLQLAVTRAHEAVEATIPLQARKGRASYLGERSQGHKDPGAVSSTFLLEALAAAVTE